MKKFDRLVEVAKAMKLKEQTGNSFHVSFVLKKSKVVAIGVNSYVKRNPICLEYKPTKSSAKLGKYIASIHSEIDATAKVKYNDFDNYTLVNIRINNNGNVANSCPCPNCFKQILKMPYVKRVFYSNDEGNFQRLPV